MSGFGGEGPRADAQRVRKMLPPAVVPILVLLSLPSSTSAKGGRPGCESPSFAPPPLWHRSEHRLLPPPHRPVRGSRPALSMRRSNTPNPIGSPSTPGWKGDRLSLLTDWAVSSEANRPIVCEYEPNGEWLWARWEGTVLSMTVAPIVLVMMMSGTIDIVVHWLSSSSWSILDIPPADDPNVMELQGIRRLWEYQLTLCTFILTFFTQEAYRHYRTVYLTTRAIQGRINDICMLVTIGATRSEEEMLAEGGEALVTGYSEQSVDLVDTCTRLIRLSHTFFWAATPTASNGVGDSGADLQAKGKAIGPLLLSAQGLDGLVSKGELTEDERDSLLTLRKAGLPPSQYAYVLLEWVGLYTMNGRKAGILIGDGGFEENLVRQFTSLRAEYFNIGDYSAGRMPVAYVQLVQVLVDSLVALAPLALYPDLGTLSIPLCGLLTLFFKGQLELSKSLLDPFGVEGFRGQNIRVDVLVSELNFGAGSRWVKAGEVLPKLPCNTKTNTGLTNSKTRQGSLTARRGAAGAKSDRGRPTDRGVAQGAE